MNVVLQGITKKNCPDILFILEKAGFHYNKAVHTKEDILSQSFTNIRINLQTKAIFGHGAYAIYEPSVDMIVHVDECQFFPNLHETQIALGGGETCTINGDGSVKVGCQEIPREKIDEIYNAMRRQKEKNNG